MGKKIILGIFSALLLSSTVGLIGWIGFQERLRLALQKFQEDTLEVTSKEDDVQQEILTSQEADHSVVETGVEAKQVVAHLEGLLRSLEDDNIPTE